MRVKQSILCAGLAMFAVSLRTSMTAVAAVPSNVQVAVQTITGTDYPAMAIVYQDVAVLPSELTVTGFA